MEILILGANGFIGSHLCEAILAKTNWSIYALDLMDDKLKNCLGHKNFHFHLGDMTLEKEWIETHLKQSDVILPMAAIATPASYIKTPLRVFELDFEANLEIIRQCVHFEKHLVFPSTSEVYGMCSDDFFDEKKSNCVTGPIHKERWIYSTSKQLLDRLIYAYGKQKKLKYTLFRPFNWYGPRLDTIHDKTKGSSRVLTQFIGNILRGENIMIVNGGEQMRCFTYIDDGINALLKIIENKKGCAEQEIFNIGNPSANISIRDLAKLLIQTIKRYPAHSNADALSKLENVSADTYYGEGYQDIALRVPAIHRAKKSLNWNPKVTIEEGLGLTLDYYITLT